MNDTQIKILAIFGAICLLWIVLLFLSIGISILREFIDAKKLEYRQKHRFDKPPTAACYCKDCVKFNPKKGIVQMVLILDTWPIIGFAALQSH